MHHLCRDRDREAVVSETRGRARAPVHESIPRRTLSNRFGVTPLQGSRPTRQPHLPPSHARLLEPPVLRLPRPPEPPGPGRLGPHYCGRWAGPAESPVRREGARRTRGSNRRRGCRPVAEGNGLPALPGGPFFRGCPTLSRAATWATYSVNRPATRAPGCSRACGRGSGSACRAVRRGDRGIPWYTAGGTHPPARRRRCGSSGSAVR